MTHTSITRFGDTVAILRPSLEHCTRLQPPLNEGEHRVLEQSNTQTERFWCNSSSAIWNNDGDVMSLFDASGNLVVQHTE